jgi:histidyl-tRNA synthetase
VKIDNSPARGTRDLLPANVAVRDHVLESITTVYRRFGYQRIETPALEDIARLRAGRAGRTRSSSSRCSAAGSPTRSPPAPRCGTWSTWGCGYDLTVPLTRFYGNNHAQLPSPFRSLQVGPVWRAERPQKGRYRQFYQCDIDLIGEPSVLAEAELIEATSQALAAVGLEGTTVRLSDRRFLAALAEAAGLPEASWDSFFIILDKLDKIGWDGVRPNSKGSAFPRPRSAPPSTRSAPCRTSRRPRSATPSPTPCRTWAPTRSRTWPPPPPAWTGSRRTSR